MEWKYVSVCAPTPALHIIIITILYYFSCYLLQDYGKTNVMCFVLCVIYQLSSRIAASVFNLIIAADIQLRDV